MLRRMTILLSLGLAGLACASEPFRVALTGKYPPFSFYNQEGELDGFDVEVAHEVAASLGRELRLVPTEWDGILVGLKGGKFDAIIGSMAVTPAREEQVDFSQPYYTSGAQLFVHKRNSPHIHGLDDCAGRRIGVVTGETFEQFLKQQHPEVRVVAHTSTVEIFENLSLGRIDGFVSDLLVGSRQIEEADMPFVRVGPLLYRERMAIPVRRGEEALLGQINAALASLRADGRLERMALHWLGPAGRAAVSEPSAAEGFAADRMKPGTVARLLGKGFALTLIIAIASLTAGFLGAIPLGVVLNGGHGPLHVVVRALVDFIRGTPVLVQLFFVHFGLPYVGMTFAPMVSAIVTLSINAAAYMAEVVRAGLMSVDRGQPLAARALGLTRRQAFLLVVWPQAFRIAMPPLMNSVVALIKDTALVGIVSVPEVLTMARSITAATFNPVYYFVVAIMFFAVTFPLMKLAAALERRLKQRGFAHG